jgi:hypothetical protein
VTVCYIGHHSASGCNTSGTAHRRHAAPSDGWLGARRLQQHLALIHAAGLCVALLVQQVFAICRLGQLSTCRVLGQAPGVAVVEVQAHTPMKWFAASAISVKEL